MNRAMEQLEVVLSSRNERKTLAPADVMGFLRHRSNSLVLHVFHHVDARSNSKKLPHRSHKRSSQTPSLDNNKVEAKGRSRQ